MQVLVTATDTNIGKTVVSSWLAMHLNAYYYKPIQSGVPFDTECALKLGVGLEKILPAVYQFLEPLSPHLAAKLCATEIEMQKLINLPHKNPLIVEGCGGVMVPLNEEFATIDLFKQWGLKTLVIARSTLGTINHTCLTVKALRDANINVVGVIMNGPLNKENKLAIEKYANVEVLQEIEPISRLDTRSLLQLKPSGPLLKAIL